MNDCSKSAMVGTTMEKEITVSKILSENELRRREMFSRFNPITGEGSIGERVLVSLDDFPIKQQWLPTDMLGNALVKALIKHNGIDNFLRNDMGVEPTPEDREAVIAQFIRVRNLFDFAFGRLHSYISRIKRSANPIASFV